MSTLADATGRTAPEPSGGFEEPWFVYTRPLFHPLRSPHTPPGRRGGHHEGHCESLAGGPPLPVTDVRDVCDRRRRGEGGEEGQERGEARGDRLGRREGPAGAAREEPVREEALREVGRIRRVRQPQDRVPRQRRRG